MLRQPKLAVQLSRAFNVPPKQFWPAVSIWTLYEANMLHVAVSSCTTTFIAWNFKLVQNARDITVILAFLMMM